MNYPTNFNQLKSYLQEGMTLTLIYSSLPDHKALNIPRKIEKKQTNAIKFEGGSWLGLGSTGEKAKDYTFKDNTFTYDGGFIKLTYQIGE